MLAALTTSNHRRDPDRPQGPSRQMIPGTTFLFQVYGVHEDEKTRYVPGYFQVRRVPDAASTTHAPTSQAAASRKDNFYFHRYPSLCFSRILNCTDLSSYSYSSFHPIKEDNFFSTSLSLKQWQIRPKEQLTPFLKYLCFTVRLEYRRNANTR